MTDFKGLARELLKERKRQSGCNTLYLYRARLVSLIGGAFTSNEREFESIRQISTATGKFTGFGMVRTINSRQPLKHLDSLYNLLAAVGKAFYLNIRVKNNGKLPQEIRYKAEVGLDKAQRESLLLS